MFNLLQELCCNLYVSINGKKSIFYKYTCLIIHVLYLLDMSMMFDVFLDVSVTHGKSSPWSECG